MLRGPLLSAFGLGWAVSMLISSTLTFRLLVDGAVSFLFIPVFQLLAFVAVYRRRPQRLPMDTAVDRFFASSAPLLLWLFALGLWCVLQSPREAALWSFTEVISALTGLVVALGWSWWKERGVLRGVESLAYRALAWSAILTYFLGISLWPELVWRVR
jgi:hypothetical protein